MVVEGGTCPSRFSPSRPSRCTPARSRCAFARSRGPEWAIRRSPEPSSSASGARRAWLDELRRQLMSWPGGPFDMSRPPNPRGRRDGVIPVAPDRPHKGQPAADVAVLFMHNESYSTPRRHAESAARRNVRSRRLGTRPLGDTAGSKDLKPNDFRRMYGALDATMLGCQTWYEETRKWPLRSCANCGRSRSTNIWRANSAPTSCTSMSAASSAPCRGRPSPAT